jgi:large subunit ribosomal protein L18
MNLNKRIRIKKKIRAKISGTAHRPRLSVFRSNRFIYAQLIDDAAGKTLVSASDLKLKGKARDRAEAVGVAIAKAAKEKKIGEAVFDRGGFRYAGRIEALAEGARKAGLKF